MDLGTYILLALLCPLGLLVGYALGWIAESELKTGKPLLIGLKEFFIALMIYFFFKLQFSFWISIIAASIFFTWVAYVHVNCVPGFSKKMCKKIKQMRSNTLVYLLLACDFFLSTQIPGYEILPSLIFLYGFPAGSLIYYYKEPPKKLIVPMMLFFVSAMILFAFPWILPRGLFQ